MIMTLCNHCADVYEDDPTRTIKQVDPKQRILEPCLICGYKGLDYEIEHVKKKTICDICHIVQK